MSVGVVGTSGVIQLCEKVDNTISINYYNIGAFILQEDTQKWDTYQKVG